MYELYFAKPLILVQSEFGESLITKKVAHEKNITYISIVNMLILMLE